MSKLTHLSLFSGIGGLDLAAEWAGFETVGQCEWADYPTKVLEKHWPDVPRWRDIRELTGEDFHAKTGRRTVDLVSGGFPCQPFSVAGKRGGQSDNRYLWPEMLRVIGELAPDWVVAENVPGILSLAADEVCSGLECEGYEVRIFNFEAAAVGAPHRRARVAFVAHSLRDGSRNGTDEVNAAKARQPSQPDASGRGEALDDAASTGLAYRADGEMAQTVQEPLPERSDWWAAEPDVGRVAHGVPNRVDRIKCLGNAVVPQQFYPIFQAIADIERGAP